MGCYTVSAVAALVHYIMRKRGRKMDDKHQKLLNYMLAGGAIFGIVDHIWNGELLAFSLSDLALGFVILLVILVSWKLMVVFDRAPVKQTSNALN